jgi:hypothetical protein
MGIIKKIKLRVGEYMLAKEFLFKKREKSVVNFADANYIGIVFNASNPENFELVKKYITYLKENKKKVKSIGFFDLKEVPQNQLSKLEYDFISRNELNWYFFPSGPDVSNFVSEPFDVIINFDLENSLSLLYLLAFSKAKFKIGKFNEKYQQYYDMMIDVEDNSTLKYFMRNVDVYLNMVNKK